MGRVCKIGLTPPRGALLLVPSFLPFILSCFLATEHNMPHLFDTDEWPVQSRRPPSLLVAVLPSSSRVCAPSALPPRGCAPLLPPPPSVLPRKPCGTHRERMRKSCFAPRALLKTPPAHSIATKGGGRTAQFSTGPADSPERCSSRAAWCLEHFRC